MEKKSKMFTKKLRYVPLPVLAAVMSFSIAPSNANAQAAPLCNGLIATVYVDDNNMIVGGRDAGEAYSGVLVGTPNADVIVGTDGNDRIISQGGNDTACGEGGDDTVGGNRGNDMLFGGTGNDLLQGGVGGDEMFGGDGDDVMNGHRGRDLLDGGAGSNIANGGLHLDSCSAMSQATGCEIMLATPEPEPEPETNPNLDIAGDLLAVVNCEEGFFNVEFLSDEELFNLPDDFLEFFVSPLFTSVPFEGGVYDIFNGVQLENAVSYELFDTASFPLPEGLSFNPSTGLFQVGLNAAGTAVDSQAIFDSSINWVGQIFIQFNDGTDGLFNVEFNNDDFNCWFGIKK